MTSTEAEQFIRELIERLGAGFHPDNSLSEYINRGTGELSFSEAERIQLEPKYQAALKALKDPYEVGLRIFKEKGYL